MFCSVGIESSGGGTVALRRNPTTVLGVFGATERPMGIEPACML